MCQITGQGETKVLIVATIAWGLRKSSRAIMLALIFLIALKPGFIHAVYCMFSNWLLSLTILRHSSSWLFILFLYLSLQAYNIIQVYSSLLIILCSDLCFSDILFNISLEPQHQQKDSPVFDSSMWGSLCTVIHSSD